MNKRGRRNKHLAGRLERWFLIVPLMSSVGLQSCASLAVDEGYKSAQGDIAVHQAIGTNRVTLMFPPDKRFAAYGVLGVPLIPTVMATRRSTEIRLSVIVELNQQATLSLPTSWCVESDAGSTLCSTGLALHAAALSSNCIKRKGSENCPFEHIEPFFSTQRPYYVPVSEPPPTKRLTLSDVNAIYGYDGSPEWSFMTLELVYRFACKDSCPKSVKVETSGFVMLDQRSVFTGVMSFTRSRITSYAPVTEIQ